jgi:hypothetical protein
LAAAVAPTFAMSARSPARSPLSDSLDAADYPVVSVGWVGMRILHVGFTAAATIAGLTVRPRVELARDSVEVPVPPAELIEVFRKRFADSSDDILAIEPHRLVRRFAGTEGPFKFKTVEVVRYEDDVITFEHLAGPFYECNERFEFAPTPSGTLLTHSGSFRLRGGVWTAALAIGPVKKAFESHVHGHFQNLANELSATKPSAT